MPDFEFVLADGAPHVSRFTLTRTLNAVFRDNLGAFKKLLLLGEAEPCRLETEAAGQPESMQ